MQYNKYLLKILCQKLNVNFLLFLSETFSFQCSAASCLRMLSYYNQKQNKQKKTSDTILRPVRKRFVTVSSSDSMKSLYMRSGLCKCVEPTHCYILSKTTNKPTTNNDTLPLFEHPIS